ncbi:hypothetical protein AB3N04_06515 [Alkalihalophilus sp. As8PL]|uniref:Uncharacterized protein n=1 Tax=Alkalihalophilus sp. As8PL TaxID=3237103 RepID=A0AB39BWP6_9BACI
MKKIVMGFAAGALALTVFSSSAFAAVTFDSTTGTGFVGKGDVQNALGLNNAQLQKEAADLKFTYESVDTYEITVEWTTGEGTRGEQTHTVEHNKTSSLTSDINSQSRTAKQINGFNLNGLSNTIAEGSIPKVGENFPGNSGHKVTEVNLVSSTNTYYVNGVALD